MTMTKKIAIVLANALLGVASGFSHVGPAFVRPAARHASIFSMADGHIDPKLAAPAEHQVANNNRTATGRRRRRGKRGGKNKRRVSEAVAPVVAIRSNGNQILKWSHHFQSRGNIIVALKQLVHNQPFLDPWKTRLLLREALTGLRRGVTAEEGSIDFTIGRCKNDFELVARAGKEVEYLLETYFGAPPGKMVSLPVKINRARTADGEPLSRGLQKRMKHLQRTRNALVHKRGDNRIRHRRAFLDGLDEVLRELAVETERVQLQRQGEEDNNVPSSPPSSPARTHTAKQSFVILTEFVAQLPLARMPVRVRGRAQAARAAGGSGAAGDESGEPAATDADVYRA